MAGPRFREATPKEREAFEAVEREAAKRGLSDAGQLITNDRGQIKACEFNAKTLLAAEPLYDPIHHDEFLCRTRFENRDWSDHDDRNALCWLQATHRVSGFTLGQVRNAVLALAYTRRRDSLREYVHALSPWDGVERISGAFSRAWGAPEDPLTCAASSNFFVALIARAERPGAQVDTLWTFEGPQGCGKSAALRALCGQFHAEITAQVGTTDFMRELRGLWLAELSELDSLRGREASTVKRLLSAPADRFVEKFERNAATYPRRAVAVATTNEAHYWQDATGARRLIPVKVGRIDLQLIAQEREQWLAEARASFREGASWWQFPGAIADAQEERQQVDPWEDILRGYMDQGGRRTSEGNLVASWSQGFISSAEILQTWLRLDAHQQNQQAGPRLGRVMRRLDYRPARSGKARIRGWEPDTSDDGHGKCPPKCPPVSPPSADT